MVADKIGRRKASIYSVAGFGVITLLIALLPGYGSIGIASYWLLVLLRFLDGICLGGGYTGAHPLAIEYAEKSQRGFVGGLILAAFPLAYVVINLVAMAMFAIFPLHGANSPYVKWGWRIPFVIGAALAGLLAFYYAYQRARIGDLGDRDRSGRRKLPLFGSPHRSQRAQPAASSRHDDRLLAHPEHHHHLHPDDAAAAHAASAEI